MHVGALDEVRKFAWSLIVTSARNPAPCWRKPTY